MSRQVSTAALGASALAFVCCTSQASAQTAAAPQPSASPFAPSGAIEQVVVTARRRPEDIQKIPVAVTAISGDELREKDVKSAMDLQNLAPSLSVSGNLGSRDTDVFSIRGQSQPFGGADPGVQTYFAEVPFGASGVGNEYDMETVQVLNGPQGTLFGRNTTGGAILFEPKKPTDAFGGYLDGELGDYGVRELQGAVNIPVVGDQFMIRAAGDFASRDGYTKDFFVNPQTGGLAPAGTLDNVNYDAFRIAATVRPFPGFENYAVFNYLHDQNNGTSAELTGVNTTTIDKLATLELQPLLNPVGLASCPLPAQYGNYPAQVGQACGALLGFEQAMVGALQLQKTLGPRGTTSTISPLFKRDTWDAVDIAKYDVTNHLHLRNIFGYISDLQQSGFDYDGSFLPILEIPNNRTWESNSLQVTEEFQVSGESDDDSVNWIFGFYHELDHPGGYAEVIRDTFGGAQPPSANPLSSFGTTEIDALANGGTSNAVYGSATYDASALAQGLSFTAGGRYTWDHKDATSSSCILQDTSATCPLPISEIGALRQSADFRAPTWTLATNYQVTDDTMLYATYRRGYKSGGFNSGAGAATDFSEFKPEYLTDVELGTKNNWTILGVPGRTDFDVYYGWYDDVQKNDLIDVVQELKVPPFENFQPVALTFNAARASIKGLEFQSTFVPDDNFQVNVFYSYTDATYSRFVLPQEVFIDLAGNQAEIGTLDHAGNPFSYTPRNKVGISPSFHIPIDPSLGAPIISSAIYWQSSEWFTDLSDIETTCSAFAMPSPPPNQPYTCLAPGGQRPEQKSYGLVNFRFDWNNFLGQPVDASVFVDNAFNETYQVGANALLHLTGTNASIYGPPRMWGVELRYRFGADGDSSQ